jgi:fluoroquinolone transport system permease protein
VTRLATTLRWEATLQARHHFYSVTAVVAIAWIGLVRLLPDAVRAYPASVIPFFVLVNLQITAFYFSAALILLERAQGITAAFLTSPLRPGEQLWVKTLSLTALGTVENAVIVLFVFGPATQWAWLLAGTAFLAALYVLLGAAAVARHTALNTFLVPSVGWVTLCSLPLLSLFGLTPYWLFAWHPMTPPLLLLEASSRPLSLSLILIGAFGSAAWCAAAFFWARSRLMHIVAPAAA